ncbi:MAG: S41 family peptidase [Muribaculaceae bacterium]|nr:S41 family peptidase [Muribaculaceae bacterium]MBR3101950.1 S41 family peptidase [Muribaculaceae bacterium]
MKSSPKSSFLWLPLAMAVAVVVGIFIGNRFSSRKYAVDNDRKLNTILNLIADDYVDTTNINELIELSIPEILSNLDPHTTYFSAEDLKAANEDLNGSFSGIGISFMMMNDSISVIEVIPGGPSEKVGIMPGDRIVTVNDSVFVGPKVTSNDVVKCLRGDKGSQVKLGIKRNTSSKLLSFTVTRGDIPVNSVDAFYMLDKTTGYIKVNQFGFKTYDEFLNGLNQLKQEGAKRYVIDLRGNGGGYMERAILMANEFLPADQLIVFTKGRYKRDDSMVWSDGSGSFKDAEVVVLIDEYSASASEIFAGAIQDNDRGLIVGCRSFGKGLVQQQFVLPDSSAVRLTIARYYTPSGRCIQKDYKNGVNYDKELYDRYMHGELYSRDSMKVDKSQIFTTNVTGRTVYGGGGVVPDIFVPRDTTGVTSYYIDVANAGLLQKYAFHYTDINRKSLKQMKDYKQFLRMLPSDSELLNDFVDYASHNGVTPRWYYINLSRDLIVTNIKALIARDIFGNSAFYPIFNRNDKTIAAALKALNKHKAVFPIRNE